jgi:arsenate reductase (glutaredoxin)
MITMYGITNCDTIKKARAWLDAKGMAYTFHDYKRSGVDRRLLEEWCGSHGWEAICNRAGTTFRKLPEATTRALDARKAVALMLDHPSMIKRPILDIGGRVSVGFSPEAY